jgi:O-antigen ligase
MCAHSGLLPPAATNQCSQKTSILIAIGAYGAVVVTIVRRVIGINAVVIIGVVVTCFVSVAILAITAITVLAIAAIVTLVTATTFTATAFTFIISESSRYLQGNQRGAACQQQQGDAAIQKL